MKTEMKIVYPDYKKIREESCRIDCMVTQADFNTMRPNPCRVSITASDVNRYLCYKNGGRFNGVRN